MPFWGRFKIRKVSQEDVPTGKYGRAVRQLPGREPQEHPRRKEVMGARFRDNRQGPSR